MKIKNNSLLELISVFLCVIYKILLASNIMNTSDKFIYVIIILFFCTAILSLLNKKMYKKDFVKLLILGVIGFFSIVMVESVNYVFPIIIASIYYDKENKEESVKKIIRNFFICLLFGYIFIIFLNLIGILPSHDLIRFKNGTIVTRHSLGFSHPAFVGLYYTFIMFAYFYLKKTNIINVTISIVLSYVIYKICDSRTSLICNYIFIIMMILRNNRNLKKYMPKISPYLFIIFTIFTIVSSYAYYKYNVVFLDEFFSGRLSIYNNIINNYNILKLPFGSKNYENIILDNYYLTIFLYFGYIGYVLWAIFYIKTQKNMSSNIIFLIIQFVILFYGMTDSNVIVSSINFMLSVQFLQLLYNVTDVYSNKKLKENNYEKNKYNNSNI